MILSNPHAMILNEHNSLESTEIRITNPLRVYFKVILEYRITWLRQRYLRHSANKNMLMKAFLKNNPCHHTQFKFKRSRFKVQRESGYAHRSR